MGASQTPLRTNNACLLFRTRASHLLDTNLYRIARNKPWQVTAAVAAVHSAKDERVALVSRDLVLSLLPMQAINICGIDRKLVVALWALRRKKKKLKTKKTQEVGTTHCYLTKSEKGEEMGGHVG
ncbi:hypothetical protein Tco_0527143 [Tanacetum coccineum]